MMIRVFPLILVLMASALAPAQTPPPDEGGVSQELSKWRAAQYSNVRYKLDLTLEKMSPVLKGTMEIRVTQAAYACAEPDCPPLYIVLDWRKIPGHEKESTISNVSLNGVALSVSPLLTRGLPQSGRPDVAEARAGGVPAAASASGVPMMAISGTPTYEERNEHLIFHEGVKMGENVIKLDFTSPILTSGSAITRYIDKEDGSEYIYSLFVPSDASTAFPVFDQPDLKARFRLKVGTPDDWQVISNGAVAKHTGTLHERYDTKIGGMTGARAEYFYTFGETQPISTYVFAFAAGPWKEFTDAGTGGGNPSSSEGAQRNTPSDSRTLPTGRVSASTADVPTHIYVRASQTKKFEPHSKEIFRLTLEGVSFLNAYFDYKFPWPKYDLVLIPEFPFGGMEHAGATFLRESSIIFPTEPTKSDFISRANLIFHETAHQWFGDTVTMRWFDDLWLKEGFAEFMAYKTLEAVMPEANAWKVFYERNKQAAYATDSTRGTTPIYQPIKNLSAAKSAYGNIVYRKAPSFLRQAEFYLGEDKFQTAVRAFLKKHAFANAGWEGLVKEFGAASGQYLDAWAEAWVKRSGAPVMRVTRSVDGCIESVKLRQTNVAGKDVLWPMALQTLSFMGGRGRERQVTGTVRLANISQLLDSQNICNALEMPEAMLPNYGDFGYGIFLLDSKSRDYVLKNIPNEKDPFLRSMMWGALWDSVREAELDPRQYVELVINNLSTDNLSTEPDETIVASLLGRVSTALNYYVSQGRDLSGREGARKPSARQGTLPTGRVSASTDLRARFEAVLVDRLQNAATPGQRITFFRAFVNNASTDRSRAALKEMLLQSTQQVVSVPPAAAGGLRPSTGMSQGGSRTSRGSSKTASLQPPATAGGTDTRVSLPLKTKDKFDIVTRLAILNDPDASRLLAELEKTETSDDAKRYAYAAHAAFSTADNRAKFWDDFVNNKQISESWVEAAIGPFNAIRNANLSQPYLERALNELPNLKRTRKIFFINNWLGAFIGGQRDEKALAIVNKFLGDHPQLDNDLRLKILENIDVIERAVKIRSRFSKGN